MPGALNSFDDTLAYWKAKKAVSYGVFDKMTAEAKNTAFSTALDYSEATMTELAASLDAAIKAGETVYEWKADFEKILLKFGYDPEQVPAFRLNLLYRQNIINAFTQGRYADMFSDAAQLEHPAWRFLAIHDRRTDDACVRLDGTVFYKGDPRGRIFLPPIHWLCRCSAQGVTAQELADAPDMVGDPQAFLDQGIAPDEGFDFDKARSIRQLLQGRDPTQQWLPSMPHTVKTPFVAVGDFGQLAVSGLTAEETTALAEEETKKVLALQKAEKIAGMKAQITKTAQVKKDLVAFGKANGLSDEEAKAAAKKFGSLVSHGTLTAEEANAQITVMGASAKEAAKQAWVESLKTFEGVPTWVTHKLADEGGAIVKWGPGELEKELLARMITQAAKDQGLTQEIEALWFSKWEGLATKDFLASPKAWEDVVAAAKQWGGAVKAEALGATGGVVELSAKAGYVTAKYGEMSPDALANYLARGQDLEKELGLEMTRAIDAVATNLRGQIVDIAEKYGLDPEDVLAEAKKRILAAPKIPFSTLINGLESTGLEMPAALKVVVAEAQTAALPVVAPAKFSVDGWSLVDANPKMKGAFEKQIWQDAQGQKWLFKPEKKGASLVKSYADQVAGKLGRLIVPENSVESEVVTLGGRTGSVQRLVVGAKDLPGLASLTNAQLADIQKQQVLDWLLGNHDAHSGQWIVKEDGTIVGIDKSQAFKYYGKDFLSGTYHPNAAFGESPPIYNLIAQGKAGFIDPQGILPALDRAVAIPDDVLRSILQPYAEARFGTNAKAAEEFIGQVIARKNNLKANFEAFYSAIQKEAVTFKVNPAFPGETPSSAAPMKAAADAKVGMTAKEWAKKEFEKTGTPWSDSYSPPKTFVKWYEADYKGAKGYQAIAEDGSKHFFPGTPPPQLNAPTLEAWKKDKVLQAKLEKTATAAKAKAAKLQEKMSLDEKIAEHEARIRAQNAMPTLNLAKTKGKNVWDFIQETENLDRRIQKEETLAQAATRIFADGTRGHLPESAGIEKHLIGEMIKDHMIGELKVTGLTHRAAQDAFTAARTYCGILADIVNGELRKGGDLNKLFSGTPLRDWVKRLDDFVKHSVQFRKDVPLFRGAELTVAQAANLKVGGIFSDPGFGSTSTSPMVGRAWTKNVMIEYLPGPKRSAVEVFGLSASPSEREVLYARDCKFKVHAFRKITPSQSAAWGGGNRLEDKWLLVLEEV